MERSITGKVYCQSIKYYDSSHCIIQKKYYFPILSIIIQILSIIIQISIVRTKEYYEESKVFLTALKKRLKIDHLKMAKI